MKPTLVVLVGPPGAGKSTFCKQVLPDFFRISQDEMGRMRHFTLFTDALTKKEHIVLDKTNAAKADRQRYTDLAKQHGYNLAAVFFDIDYDTCLARIENRTGHKYSKTRKRKDQCIIGLKAWFTRIEEPTEDEGFGYIAEVHEFTQEDLANNSDRAKTHLRMDLGIEYDIPLGYRFDGKGLII